MAVPADVGHRAIFTGTAKEGEGIMGKRVRRLYQITYAAQDGTPIEAIKPPLSEEEKKDYWNTVEECKRWRAQGIEPSFYFPVDAFDDDDDDDIYSENFDREVMEEVERLNREQQEN